MGKRGAKERRRTRKRKIGQWISIYEEWKLISSLQQRMKGTLDFFGGDQSSVLAWVTDKMCKMGPSGLAMVGATSISFFHWGLQALRLLTVVLSQSSTTPQASCPRAQLYS
eukprot:765304-Hanusia_phi.AAC.3